MELIRVVIVDDHSVVRSGLRHLLEACADIVVVGEADDGSGAIRLTEQLLPDVILLDIRLADTNGLDILPRLRRLAQQTRIIVLTSYDDEQYLAKAIRLGAHGFLLKSASDRTITESIRRAHKGERFVDGELITKVLVQMQKMSEVQTHLEAGLSAAEVEALKLMAEGATNREIAERLFISERTAKRRVHSLFTKLGTNSRAQTVNEAGKRGII